MGAATIAGVATQHIRLRHVASKQELNLGSAKTSEIDFFFDPSTCVIVKTQDTYYPDSNTQQGYLRELYFSDYRLESGALVPHTVSEVFARQKTWSLQLDVFAFNAGLSDSDFEF